MLKSVMAFEAYITDDCNSSSINDFFLPDTNKITIDLLVPHFICRQNMTSLTLNWDTQWCISSDITCVDHKWSRPASNGTLQSRTTRFHKLAVKYRNSKRTACSTRNQSLMLLGLSKQMPHRYYVLSITY